LPASLSTSAFWVLAAPALHLTVITQLSSSATALTLGLLTVAFALIMSQSSTPLYRLLEGYTWPESFRTAATSKQRETKQSVQEAIRLLRKPEAAAGSDSRSIVDSKGTSLGSHPIELSLLYEKLKRYPSSDDQVVATRLGNAMRAAETFAGDRYQLNSQLFWTELVVCVPDALRDELDSSRSGIDFFVHLTYQALLTGLIIVLAAIGGRVDGSTSTGAALLLTVLGLVVGLSAKVWYELSIQACSYFYSTVQAMVNLGRKGLAEGLGLQLPTSIDQEREMWQRLAVFVFHSFISEDRRTRGDFDSFRMPDLQRDNP
jgi:hypothetical protein